jgi:hypothetical protein
MEDELLNKISDTTSPVEQKIHDFSLESRLGLWEQQRICLTAAGIC